MSERTERILGWIIAAFIVLLIFGAIVSLVFTQVISHFGDESSAIRLLRA